MKRLCPFCHHDAFIDTICPICGATIEEIREAEEALEKMQRKYIDIVCPQCGKTESSGQLILIGPDLQCNYCGKIMNPKEWLQYMKKEKNDIDYYSDEECSYMNLADEIEAQNGENLGCEEETKRVG